MMTRLRRGLMLRPQAQPVTIPAFWAASEGEVVVEREGAPHLGEFTAHGTGRFTPKESGSFTPTRVGRFKLGG